MNWVSSTGQNVNTPDASGKPGQSETMTLVDNNGVAALTITKNASGVYDLTCAGTITDSNGNTVSKPGSSASTATSVTFDSTYYGKTFLWSPSGTAAGTLPANGAAAGSWFEVLILTDNTVTISAATADTLIVDGDTQADSVAFSTASHKIGSAVMFVSNGSFWIAINLGSTTMTIAT
jgi:hypothetical protein